MRFKMETNNRITTLTETIAAPLGMYNEYDIQKPKNIDNSEKIMEMMSVER